MRAELKRRRVRKEIKMIDMYEKIEKVGEGTYGKVYKARHSQSGQIVALKKTRLHSSGEGIPATTLREVALLQMLSHNRHVVRLLDVESKENKDGQTIMYLVFEFLDFDLKEYIKSVQRSSTRMPVKIIKNFIYQLCMAVAFCHSHGVMHRDLKPQNLLVDKRRGLLKVADLGLSRAFTVPIKEYTHEIVTLWYRAPEVLLGATHYSTPVDMWSVGCIFAELYRLIPLFRGDSELRQLLEIFRCLGTPNEEVWPEVTQLIDWHVYPQWKPQHLSVFVPDMEPAGIDLLRKMLTYNPSRRISAKMALQHPYFAEL